MPFTNLSNIWTTNLDSLRYHSGLNPFTPVEVVGGGNITNGLTMLGSLGVRVQSSNFDTPNYTNATVGVNGPVIVDVAQRGHTLVVIDPNTGDLISATTFDTYAGGVANTNLTNALNAVVQGNIMCLISWDATSFTSDNRAALVNGYGATLTNTWTAGRVSHYFIGVKN